MPPAAPPQRPGGELQPCGRTEAAAAPSHNAPLTPPWGGGEKVPLPGLGSAEGSEKCARALTSAGPSNQSSDSSNGRNGEYPLGLVAKEEKGLEVEKGDCGVLRVRGSSISGRKPVTDAKLAQESEA